MVRPDPLVKYKALQDENEIQAFGKLLASEGVTSYLEIGSKFGGSLYRVANNLPLGSKIVSVDTNINGPELQFCINYLNNIGYDAHLIPLNSTLPEAIKRAKDLGPYDAVFIDGDHRPAGILADWTNYGPMGKIIGFHDIGWKRAQNWVGKRIDVPQFWDSIKTPYRHQEIKLDPTGKNCGIGVLWNN